MITVEEALQIVLSNAKFLQQKKKIKVKDSLGYLLAEDIYSPLDLPPFNQSNVDGFAVRFSSEQMNDKEFFIRGEVKAGDSAFDKLKKGEARPVYTGAMVPEGADAVIMKEQTETDGKILRTSSEKISRGDFIRMKGSQIRKNEPAMKSKTQLTPGAIGFLQAMGIKKISVSALLKISIVVTGNELVPAGKKLPEGKVYESNSSALQAALQEMNLCVEKIKIVEDDKRVLKKIIEKILADTDVLIISGGVSVGKYDFVTEVLEELNVKELFHTVSQRPGKPMYFGRRKKSLIFGLPGNPSSALTCFYEYVYPALNVITGRKKLFLKKENKKLADDFKTASHLSYFVRGKVDGDKVKVLEGTESYKMKAYAEADALIYFPKGKELRSKEQIVEVHLLPNN